MSWQFGGPSAHSVDQLFASFAAKSCGRNPDAVTKERDKVSIERAIAQLEMRRLPRAQQIVDLFFTNSQHPRTSRSVCRSCRLRTTSQRLPGAAPFSSSATRPEAFGENMRNAIWGKEEAHRQRRGVAQEGSESNEVSDEASKLAEETAEHKEYREATTWEGLEWVGGSAWADRMRDTGYQFEGSVGVCRLPEIPLTCYHPDS